MDIRTRLDGEEMHIELEGRFDAAWSGTVNKTLQDALHAGCHCIALDLAKVGYLSSAGIRVLVMLAKQLKTIGGRLRIVEASPPVREVLKLVGFHNLLEEHAAPSATATPRPAVMSEPRTWQSGEHRFEVYDLNPAATLHGALIGDPERALALGPRSCPPVALEVPAASVVVGLGALGEAADCHARAGELLAVDGLAIALPGDDPAHPDWLAQEGDLVPKINLLYGFQTSGAFRHLLRFGALSDAPALSLSELAQATLELCQCEQAILVVVAETASLVGVALQTSPERMAGDWFAFPEVRDRMLFTAEPAYADETCLIAGLVTREASPSLAPWLRPLGKSSNLNAHLHAAVMPYHPVHKGLVTLRDTLDALMDSETVRGVLHLIHDDREGIGAGESYLRRGAVWCAPVRFVSMLSHVQDGQSADGWGPVDYHPVNARAAG